MNWQSPQYQEVKMDAEIGSYQPDGETPWDGDVVGHDEPCAVAMNRAERVPG